MISESSRSGPGFLTWLRTLPMTAYAFFLARLEACSTALLGDANQVVILRFFQAAETATSFSFGLSFAFGSRLDTTDHYTAHIGRVTLWAALILMVWAISDYLLTKPVGILVLPFLLVSLRSICFKDTVLQRGFRCFSLLCLKSWALLQYDFSASLLSLHQTLQQFWKRVSNFCCLFVTWHFLLFAWSLMLQNLLCKLAQLVFFLLFPYIRLTLTMPTCFNNSISLTFFALALVRLIINRAMHLA